MFVDKVDVLIRAGKGGNGKLSFRHEKYVERGGPDGGDGGDGGDVIVIGSNNQNTLANFRFKKLVNSEPGEGGEKRKKHGKRGKDLLLKLPVGTVVTNKQGEVLADLIYDGQQQLIARGGKGGFGNAHFVSSTRQAPRMAELGDPGEEFEAVFELKMLADVGLVGLPNAGKSTLLSIISNAHPEIANYPFTTLKPNLGVVDIDNQTTVLFADIPGLIEGASQGKGLGDEFLRHVERTKLLIHLIDAYQEDITGAYKTIINELAKYTIDLSKRPQIVVINKIEGLDTSTIENLVVQIRSVAKKGTKIMAISAQSGKGTKELLYEAKKILTKIESKKLTKTKPELPVIRLDATVDSWQIEKTAEGFIVTGRKIEKFANRTDLENFDGINRLRDIMRKMGITHELERKKISPDDKIYFGKTKIGPINY